MTEIRPLVELPEDDASKRVRMVRDAMRAKVLSMLEAPRNEYGEIITGQLAQADAPATEENSSVGEPAQQGMRPNPAQGRGAGGVVPAPSSGSPLDNIKAKLGMLDDAEQSRQDMINLHNA
jgi:hypothetical protein